MNFRLRCFALHLIASLVLAAIAVSIVFGVLYPSPFGEAVGVTEIFLVLLGVDVVLGPLLTLLVANKEKKTLKFDLSVIVVLQLSAFVYGMSVVASGRPVWIVFSGDRFDLVQAYQLERSDLEKAAVKYQRLSWMGPNWVAARMPENVDERNHLTFESVFGGRDLPQRPEMYVPYADEIENVQRHAFALNKLNQFNTPQEVSRVLDDWPEANSYLPMMARAKPMTVLLRRETGQVLGVVPLNPW